jgi:hypothetical protein
LTHEQLFAREGLMIQKELMQSRKVKLFFKERMDMGTVKQKHADVKTTKTEASNSMNPIAGCVLHPNKSMNPTAVHEFRHNARRW